MFNNTVEYIDALKNTIDNSCIYKEPIVLNIKTKQNIRKMKRELQAQETLNKIQNIKICLINSNIDFSKIGWVNRAGVIIGCTHRHVGRWMNKHMNEFYKKCYKRKKYAYLVQ